MNDLTAIDQTVDPIVEPNNLKTFFDAAHNLNSDVEDWIETGVALLARRDRLIELSPKCGVHKSATRDALAKVALPGKPKADKEPEPAPLLDFIAGSATDEQQDGSGEGTHE